VVCFAGNLFTTKTQRTQRLHREEGVRDFLCKADPRIKVAIPTFQAKQCAITQWLLKGQNNYEDWPA